MCVCVCCDKLVSSSSDGWEKKDQPEVNSAKSEIFSNQLLKLLVFALTLLLDLVTLHLW